MADWFVGASVRAAQLADRVLWDLAPAQKSAPAGAFAIGSVVDGRYKLEAVLGEGAFGRVWRARSLEEDRLVALKELRGREQQTREQFESEFFLLSRLKHPNIVRVLDYGEAPDGTRYLVMELVPGRDLTDLTKRGPLPREQAAAVIAGLLQALQLLHARLLVHCDIKADNVRLTTRGDVKLMDFGLLHQLGTPVAGVSGTVVTMSPEMMQGGVIDGRADLYSVGCVSYELFTGELPFKGGSIAEVMQRVQHEAPRPPSYFLDVPPAIDQFVLTLLAKKPEARFSDAGAALRALQAATGVKADDGAGLHRTSYLFSPELVARDAERAQLEEARARAAEGAGGALFISGKSGEGKTRLLDDVRLKAKLARMQWCAAQCRPGVSTPLKPIAEALSAIAERIPDEVLGEHGAALARLLPSLGERVTTPPSAADPSEQKARALAGVVAALRAVAARTPVVLVLEDLHAADAATLEVLNHVIRSCGNDAVLVLGTMSSTEIDRTSLAFVTVHEGRARLLDLAPLPRDALPRLLNLTLGAHDIEAARIDELYGVTEGNALALFETLRALIERGDLLMDKENHWRLQASKDPLPHGTAQAFALRFARMPAELAATARALAAAGSLVDPPVAADVLAVDRAALHDRLESLVAAQVLKREGREVVFANEIIRRAIYDALPEAERKELHDRVGAALSKRPSGQADAATLAFHLVRGVQPTRALPHLFSAAATLEQQQPLEAIKHLQEAAKVAQSAAQPAERHDNLVRALDRMAGYTNLAPPVAAQAIEQLGGVWASEVRWPEVAAALRAQHTRAAALPSWLRAPYRQLFDAPVAFTPSTHAPRALLNRWVQHRTWQAVALAILGQRDKALATADEAESFLDALDDPNNLRDLVEVPRIICAVNTGMFTDALARIARIRDRLGEVNTPRTPEINYARFWSLYGHTVTEALAGMPLTDALQTRLLAWLDAWNVTSFRLFGFTAPIVRASLSGDPTLFDPQSSGFEALAYRLGFPEPATSRGRAVYPQYYAQRGDMDRARPIVAKLERIAAVDKWTACSVAYLHAVMADESGALESARKVVEDGLTLARQLGSTRMASLQAAKAMLLLQDGARDAAIDEATQAVRIAAESERKNPADECMTRIALARARGGESGAQEARAAAEVARGARNKLHEAMALGAEAELTADGPRSAELASRADALFATLGNEHQRRRLAERMRDRR